MESRDIRESIATAWQRATRGDAPDDDDSFFETGGTSVAALAMLAELQSELGARIPLTLLIEHPTFGGLVARLGTLR
jgi:acyl carrier protein